MTGQQNTDVVLAYLYNELKSFIPIYTRVSYNKCMWHTSLCMRPVYPADFETGVSKSVIYSAVSPTFVSAWEMLHEIVSLFSHL